MNSLIKAAFVGMACGLAVLLMIATAPMTSANAGAIGVLMDRVFGSDWQIYPISILIPFAIEFIVYTCLIGLGMIYLLPGSDSAPDPPLDEDGRPQSDPKEVK